MTEPTLAAVDCQQCGATLDWDWQVCPYCAKSVLVDASLAGERPVAPLAPPGKLVPTPTTTALATTTPKTIISQTSAPPAGAHGQLLAKPADSSWHALRTALDNRWLVIGLLAVVGPLGLPAVWLNRRFSPATKIALTLLFFLLTVGLPLALTWYACETLLRPLVDAFPPVPPVAPGT